MFLWYAVSCVASSEIAVDEHLYRISDDIKLFVTSLLSLLQKRLDSLWLLHIEKHKCGGKVVFIEDIPDGIVLPVPSLVAYDTYLDEFFEGFFSLESREGILADDLKMFIHALVYPIAAIGHIA